MANIHILIGSVYGNATEVAHTGAEQLKGLGHEVTLHPEPQLDTLLAAEPDVLLVVTSTTGDGEIPDNLMPFYMELRDRFPLMPNVKFGVIALGDSGYANFAEAGRMMDDQLRELQATPVLSTLFIDACETADPEEAATEWLTGWQAAL